MLVGLPLLLLAGALQVPSDVARRPVEAGRRALAEGRLDEARHHFELALEVVPDPAEVLGLLVDATAATAATAAAADAHALWAHALANASLSAAGTLLLDSESKQRLGADPRPGELALARAAAVDELVKLAHEREKEGAAKPEALLVAQFARRLALDLARGTGAFERAREAELSPRLRLAEGLPAKVVKALESFAGTALTNGRTADAIEAARILAGLGAQLSWDKDLQGPRPAGVSGLPKSAAALFAKARAQLAGKLDKPWTLDELHQLDADQAEAFTRAHATFANPGVAVSPRGWYRVETDCGFNTLLGVTSDVEKHHERLVKWYGQDPFVGRPGLIRVVPQASGLESEGAPFWWAGGFQAGDTSTLRFSCGTIEGFGHGLTHELTHRFDGAVYPGIPAWLAEGRAVWTGAAFGRAADTDFVANHASIGTIEHAFIKGYGDPNNLTKLLEGTIDDYRDNYVAGYALYVYLQTRRIKAAQPFRSRLERFMKEARGVQKRWKEHFTECFCDGREGRPKEFAGFLADWAPWLAGFYWQDRKEWTREYTEEVGGVDSPLVLDEPTWVWSRHRAEPRFGQEQAALAGELLLKAGRRGDGIAALIWALAVDGRRPESETALAAALQAEGRADAAWCLQEQLAFPYAARVGAAPFLGALPRTRALLDGLDAAAGDAAGRGLVVAAAALRADRERLASWLGSERRDVGAEAVDVTKARHPFDLPARPLAPAGFGEAGLTDYEERRAKGLWYVDDEGDLHVGRRKPRDGTGTIDRNAAQVHAFALAPEWTLPGTWRLDARIRFTTSFVAGAVILGYREREENLRFQFNAGDFLYAVGVGTKEPEFNSVGWSVTGLRDRDGALPGATAGGGVDFGARASSFDLTLFVDGPLVEVSINGRIVGRYQTVDGAAIEGQIGFATSMGAVEVQGARVRRLERARLAPSRALAPTGFDLFSPRSLPPWEARSRVAFGLPSASQGTLLLWLAPPDQGELPPGELASFVQRLTWDVRELAALCERLQPTQQRIIAAPKAVGEAGRTQLAEYAKRVLGDGIDVVLHEQPFVPDGVISPKSRRWLLFVDSAGVVRALSEMPTGTFVTEDVTFTRWLHVFRDHGRPPRALPKLERPKPTGDGQQP